ncbi:aminopeptidase P family protein [Brooklawnia cerclae]|uniref:Xaa-Pro aminopeptidase n=1 Tax=Brooklawnia cerclae TaxID=349934 RepID=A0ABX0SJY1_9ACTN|nr:aminopeptidase P family protein [Brooklawnia cerclae]NIH58700.1 Xaa-Pro aminopeptidase [Brooklawnia cerclae]
MHLHDRPLPAPQPREILPRLVDIPDFVRDVGQGWAPVDRSPDLPDGLAESVAGHRRALGEAFPGAVIVVSAGTPPVRNDDAYYAFRPDSDFVWLTGCAAKDAVLVMTPAPGGHDAVLYLPEPVTASDRGYLSERERSELWVGPIPSLAEWSAALQIEVKPLDGLPVLPASGVLAAGSPVNPGPVDGLPISAELGTEISRLRRIKDAFEIGQLRQAVDASVVGFGAVASEMGTAIESGGERWLQGTFDRTARTLGHGPGYASIVAAGRHGPILHWTRCDGAITADDLILLDAGVEAETFYTADVTRTFPAGGTFSPAQRQVHDLVEASQRAGLAAVHPGAAWTAFHHACMEVLANGLHDWGLLPVSVDEALSPLGQHHRRWLICGIGHHLGLDVHDCSKAASRDYVGSLMEPGMVHTVEPGLYFHAHDLTVPPELRGIGVRIEDDVLVTDAGAEVLTAALPIDAAGLEQWAAGHA